MRPTYPLSIVMFTQQSLQPFTYRSSQLQPSKTMNNLCTSCQTNIPSNHVGESPSLDSRVVELRTCNDAPSQDGEFDLIRSSLTNAQRRLQYVQDSIAKFEESLESLKLEQRLLEDYIYDRTIVLHPIRRTPVEILTRIFSLCIETVEDAKLGFSSLDIKGMRWVLGHVCRQWRSIMLSSPQLWTDIQLELRDGGLSWPTVLLGMYIGRSQSLPLTVSLVRRLPTPFWDPAPVNEFHPYMSMLFPSAHRWSSLYLAGMGLYAIQTCLCSMKPLLVSLRFLSVSASHWNGSQCDIFQGCPVLREVVFRGVPSEALSSIRVPYRQLTTLQVEMNDQLDVSQLADYLGQMQRLEKLIVISPSYTSTGEVALGAPLILPCLRHLEIRGLLLPVVSQATVGTSLMFPASAPVNSADQILALFSLPRLEVLIVNKAVARFETIKSFLSSPPPKLSTLITDTPISEEDFIYLITNQPSLTTIDFENIQDFTDRAVEQLVIHEDRNPCLPKLDIIRLRGNLSFSAEMFVEMVESRWKACNGGKDVARPQKIELVRVQDLESLSYEHIGSFDCFNRDDFRGLERKAFETQKQNDVTSAGSFQLEKDLNMQDDNSGIVPLDNDTYTQESKKVDVQLGGKKKGMKKKK